jgi:hypothetical protein
MLAACQGHRRVTHADDLVTFIRTARSSDELRMWPMIFNGDEASTT